MIAYNTQLLNNIAVLKKVKQWFGQKLLSDDQFKQAYQTYNTPFYNPNLFIKIGLFLFTCFAISSSFGFCYLFYFSSSSHYNGVQLFSIIINIIFSIACIFVLEKFIKAKLLFRSGVDEALLYSSVVFLIVALYTMLSMNQYSTYDEYESSDNTTLWLALIILPFLIAASIRYIDRLVTIFTIIIFYSICFLLFIKIGELAKLVMPFLFMTISMALYFLIKKYQKNSQLLQWKNILQTAKLTAMIVFYLSCNYFVIREASVSFFNMEIKYANDVPLAVLFYILTALVPLIYIYIGLKTKDKLHLLAGLLLVAASALTFKYYFSMGHPEITLTIAGVLMIVVAYISVRYLKTDKFGITYKEEFDEDNFLKSNAEALVLMQSFATAASPSQPAIDSEKFGGGEFGGAGSGGNF